MRSDRRVARKGYASQLPSPGNRGPGAQTDPVGAIGRSFEGRAPDSLTTASPQPDDGRIRKHQGLGSRLSIVQPCDTTARLSADRSKATRNENPAIRLQR